MNPPNRTTVQLAFRVSPDAVAALDAWVAEINERRTVNRRTRTDVLGSLLAYGLTHRPDWAGDEPPPPESQQRGKR